MKFTLKVATAILFLSMLWRVGLADEGVVDLSGQCWELRRLNSEGHYREAEAQARVILTAPVHRLQFYRLNVLLHLYAALGRQGKGGSAQAAYCDFVEEAKLRGKNQPEVVSQMIELRRLDDKEASELSPFALKSTETLECGEQPTSDHVKLDRIIDYCRDTGADSVIIIQNGRPVASWKSKYYKVPVATMSSVKSITALLVGIAIERGLLKEEARVGDFFPDWNSGLRSSVTVKSLLTMSAGLDKMKLGLAMASASSGINDFVLHLTPSWEANSRWCYSNEGVQLLCPILEAATGESIAKFAEKNLFGPMGLEHTRLAAQGTDGKLYADAQTTIEEFSSFGQLILDGGRVNGHQLISQAWIEKMLTPCPLNPQYGYLWWLLPEGEGYAMQGYLNTSCWVLPERNLVIARTQKAPYIHVRREFQFHELRDLLTEI